MTEDYIDPLVDTVAEQQLLGGLLRHPSAHLKVLDRVAGARLCTDDLSNSALAAITGLFGSDTSSDDDFPTLVRKELVTTYGCPQGQVARWMLDVDAAAPVTSDALMAIADRVIDLYRRREIRSGLSRAHQTNLDPAGSALATTGALEGLLTDLRTGTNASDTVSDGESALQEALGTLSARMAGDRPSMIPTGSVDLDHVFGGGFEAGRLHITGGRPASGKSVFGVDTIRAALAAGHGVIALSYEMPVGEVMSRLISATCRVNTKSLRSGELTEQEASRLAGVTDVLPWKNLVLLDDSGLTVESIAAYVRQVSARLRASGCDQVLVLIDYIQLIPVSQVGGRNSSRQVELGHISRTLKGLAKTAGVAIHCLAQVGRAGAERPPTMSDLRESGDLESDADVVILLHHPSAVDPEDRPGECDFIVAKNRSGEAGVVRSRTARFQYSRFDDVA